MNALNNNDNFVTRFALSGFNTSVTGTNINFTGEIGEPDHAGISGTLNSAWWTWTAPKSGEVTLDTFGSDYDTSLAVYIGNSLSTLSAIASNDDFGSPQSQVTFDALAGMTYQIAVDGYANSTGDIALNLDLVPNNDDFANRIALTGFNVSTTGTNVGFTEELDEPNHAAVSIPINSAWWMWLAPESGQVTIDTFGSDYDTSLAIYSGNSLNTLSEVVSNDDTGGLQSQVTFDAVAGEAYQIAVDGYASATGNIDLNLNLVPNNDDFANRIALTGYNGSITGDNIGFTGEVGEPDHAAVSGPLNSAWWSWLAPEDGLVIFDTFGSDYDTSLAVYTGSSLGTLSELGSNDDAGSLQSAVIVNVVAGTAYHIAVDGVGENTGNIALNFDLIPASDLTNDDFADRIALSGFSANTRGSNIGFTGEINEPNHVGISDPINSAWWTWLAPESGQVTIDTFGSSYDTTLAVYTGNHLSTLSEVASNDDSSALQSEVMFEVVAGTTYQIAVDGYSGDTGMIDLNLNLLATPSNDNFSNRIALNGANVSTTGRNIGFTAELNEPNHASVSSPINSAWWMWLAPEDGQVTIDTFGSDYDTTLAIYTGNTLGSLSAIASNDDSDSLQSEVTFDVVAGTIYQIAVDGYSASTGNIDLNINLDPTPPNDDFAHRLALSGVSDSDTGSNIGFTAELGEPDHAGVSAPVNSAWWTWLAPDNGLVTLDTFGSDYDTSLAVYIGDSLTTLNEIVSNDDFDSLQSLVTFNAVAGTTYQIAVDGYAASTGNIALNLDLDRPPTNDDFANRLTLHGSNDSATGSTIGFTGEVNEPDHAGISGPLNSAWWTWTASENGEVTIDTFGSDYDTSLAVYIGDSLTTLNEIASNDDFDSLQSLVTFNAVAGTTYQIAVDGYFTSTGNIDLNLELDPAVIPTPVDPSPAGTVDLILDFDGGLLGAEQGYDLPTDAFDGFNFSAFTAFDQSDGSAGNMNEQIFQVLAGVREDFADFNVRVIWDDLGVESPFFDNQDTVLMIVGDSGEAVGTGNIFGIAANVDVPEFTGAPLQSQRDTGFAFLPAHVGVGPNAYNDIRELIDTISHEAGHTFGISHSTQVDSEDRQLVTVAGQNRDLDSRFSPEVLNHTEPEPGIAYAETDRLNDAVGAAATLPGDAVSSQTLPLDPTTSFVGIVDTTDSLTMGGSIDFLGDRDAFRFETISAGRYQIEQTATAGSFLNPVLTLWDEEGDFLSLGSSGSSSAITFQADANATYYAVAGSDADRLGSGVAPTGDIGGYNLQFGIGESV